jgi:hypothetical protein
MTYDILIQNLWPVGLTLQAMLTGILLWKRSWSTFPFFTAYSICSFVSTLVLFLLRHSPVAYFYAYWPAEMLCVAFDLAVLYEVFRQLFGAYRALRRMAWIALQCALAVLVLIGVTVLASSTPSQRWKLMGAALLAIEGALRMIQLGIVIFLFVFSRIFRLHWRQPVFGIALGLGIFAFAEVFVTASWLGFQAFPIGLRSIVQMLAFDAALATWGAYMFVREHVPITSTLPSQPELEQLNSLLTRIIYQ